MAMHVLLVLTVALRAPEKTFKEIQQEFEDLKPASDAAVAKLKESRAALDALDLPTPPEDAHDMAPSSFLEDPKATWTEKDGQRTESTMAESYKTLDAVQNEIIAAANTELEEQKSLPTLAQATHHWDASKFSDGSVEETLRPSSLLQTSPEEEYEQAIDFSKLDKLRAKVDAQSSLMKQDATTLAMQTKKDEAFEHKEEQAVRELDGPAKLRPGSLSEFVNDPKIERMARGSRGEWGNNALGAGNPVGDVPDAFGRLPKGHEAMDADEMVDEMEKEQMATKAAHHHQAHSLAQEHEHSLAPRTTALEHQLERRLAKGEHITSSPLGEHRLAAVTANLLQLEREMEVTQKHANTKQTKHMHDRLESLLDLARKARTMVDTVHHQDALHYHHTLGAVQQAIHGPIAEELSELAHGPESKAAKQHASAELAALLQTVKAKLGHMKRELGRHREEHVAQPASLVQQDPMDPAGADQGYVPIEEDLTALHSRIEKQVEALHNKAEEETNAQVHALTQEAPEEQYKFAWSKPSYVQEGEVDAKGNMRKH